MITYPDEFSVATRDHVEAALAEGEVDLGTGVNECIDYVVSVAAVFVRELSAVAPGNPTWTSERLRRDAEEFVGQLAAKVYEDRAPVVTVSKAFVTKVSLIPGERRQGQIDEHGRSPVGESGNAGFRALVRRIAPPFGLGVGAVRP